MPEEQPNWLTRMFDSSFFDATMAVQYLFMTDEKPVLTYLGRRLSRLPDDSVDFYLPQILNMYIHKLDVACTVHAYIEMRCKASVDFSLKCLWLLDRLSTVFKTRRFTHVDVLRRMIFEEYCIRNYSTLVFDVCDSSMLSEKIPCHLSISQPSIGEHQDCSSLRRSNSSLPLSPEHVNDYSLQSANTRNTKNLRFEHRLASIFVVQDKFVTWLSFVGAKLGEEASKEFKMSRLKFEMASMNLELPARCWVPLSDDHIVLRIPPEECCVLNSKDRTPFIIYVEVLRIRPDLISDRELAARRNRSSAFWQDDATTMEYTKEYLRHYKERTDPEDPSAVALLESWEEKRRRIRSKSVYGDDDLWDLIPLIVKCGDDLVQELFAYQLLKSFEDVWKMENVPLRLRPYKIVVTSPISGLIEPVTDACSLHQIKRKEQMLLRSEGKPESATLLSHFVRTFGPPECERYDNAQKNFIESCAAYSLICYFLQLKDRHNGNILLDAEGHLIHIDFGYLLSASPKNLGFETSPFKLTSEMLELMNGPDSDVFFYFKSLLLRGLIAARKHHERFVTLAEIMSTGSNMACFRSGADAVRALRLRFHMSYTDEQLGALINEMIESSRDSLTTRLYDNFQYYTNGIL